MRFSWKWPAAHPADHAHTARAMAIVYGLLAVAAFQFGLGLYAAALSRYFYATFGPFFDSLSYLNSLIELQYLARAKGRLAAVLDVSFRSTVVLPWMIFAPFTRAVGVARTNAVWIQIFAFAVMQFLVFLYFSRTRALPLVQALGYSAVFCLLAAVFYFNGGLSDFRMDLLQYVLFASTMTTYLIARRSGGFAWWIALGVFTGLLCLGRATSPVYLVPIFFVLATADLAGDFANWRRVVLRWLIVGLFAAAVAGWYFVLNYQHLHFYYFVWNLDANARLPLRESLSHMRFVKAHIGPWLWTILIVVALLTLIAALRQSGLAALRRLHWRALLFSVVPIGYLVLSGAGLNQFVSIVGCAGVVMFLLDPVEDEPIKSVPLFWIALSVMLAVGCGKNAVDALETHSVERVSTWIPRQAGLRQMMGRMVDAARSDGGTRNYVYVVAHTGSLNNSVVMNTLVYDHGFRFEGNMTAQRDGIRLARGHTLSNVATRVDWNRVTDATDDQKIDRVVLAFEADADFVLIATADSKLPNHVFSTRFMPEIRKRMLTSGVWEQIGEPISVSPNERVLILKNRKRLGAP